MPKRFPNLQDWTAQLSWTSFRTILKNKSRAWNWWRCFRLPKIRLILYITCFVHWGAVRALCFVIIGMRWTVYISYWRIKNYSQNVFMVVWNSRTVNVRFTSSVMAVVMYWFLPIWLLVDWIFRKSDILSIIICRSMKKPLRTATDEQHVGMRPERLIWFFIPKRNFLLISRKKWR